jgi:hypothetical protein
MAPSKKTSYHFGSQATTAQKRKRENNVRMLISRRIKVSWFKGANPSFLDPSL